jgi:hypothetical protein
LKPEPLLDDGTDSSPSAAAAVLALSVVMVDDGGAFSGTGALDGRACEGGGKKWGGNCPGATRVREVLATC